MEKLLHPFPFGVMMYSSFKEYAEKQSLRLLSGDRTNQVLVFATKEDISDIESFAQSIADKGLFIKVSLSSSKLGIDCYCFTISKTSLGKLNPYFLFKD